ncbi:MAG: alpha/beta fold hydrolase [Pseudomonadota bacterium]
MPHVSFQRLRQLRRMFAVLQAISPRLAARLAFAFFLTPARRRLDSTDAPWLAAARNRIVEAGSDRTTVHEWGTGPRTVVILHGWGSHAARFAPLAQSLVAQGWHVLAIDAPGHGRSPGRRSSLPQFINALDAVIQQLGPVQALIGHSLGALAAVDWLGQSTAQGRVDIRHVVLISGPSGVPFLINNFVVMLGLNAATARHLLHRFTDRFHRQPDGWIAAACAANIHVPVLLIHDRDDDVIPFAHAQQLLAALPQARLLATQGLGHSGSLRDAATIEQICRELES